MILKINLSKLLRGQVQLNLSSYFFVKNGQNHVEGDDIVSLFFKKKSKTQSESSNTSSKESLSSILEQLSKSGDYAQSEATNQQTNLKFSIKYLSTLVNNSIIAEEYYALFARR